MKLENGRPENTEGRLEKEVRVYDFLDKLGVEYQRVDHEAAMTMEACEEIDRTLGDGTAICKNLFLCNRQKTNFYLLMMPGDNPFKTKELSHQLGISRLSFASPEELLRLLDLTPGSVTPLGLLNDRDHAVRFCLDRDFDGGRIGVHPNDNTATVWLSVRALLALLRDRGTEIELVEI